MRRLVRLAASVFFLGYSPVAPGTAGTLAAVVMVWWLRGRGLPAYAITLGVLIPVSMWVSGRAEQLFGEHDSHRIVIDEFVGFMVAMLAIPPGWFLMAAGFFAFRMFDIVKPFPARRLESLKGGAGVVADDLMAGIYTNILLRLLMLLPGL